MAPGRATAVDEKKLVDTLMAQTDRTRRTWSFTIAMTVTLLAFSALPLVPKGHVIIGRVTPLQVFLAELPGIAFLFSSMLIYRRFGSSGRGYRVSEALEMAGLYGSTLAIPVLDEQASSLLWAMQVPGALFWAAVKPGFSRRYGLIVAALNIATVAAVLAQGRWADAGLATLIGITSLVAFVVVARGRLRAVRAEAERNVMRARLAEARLEHGRRRTEQELTQDVGQHLESLASELHRLGRAEAAEVRRMVEMVSDIVFPLQRELSVGELGQLCLSRCERLCSGLSLAIDPIDALRPVPSPTARAVLRIAQELVRNAVTHGKAANVRLQLSLDAGRAHLRVSDDGVGLSSAALAGSTGGLKNARTWSEEVGGHFALVPQVGWQTTLVATLPTPFGA